MNSLLITTLFLASCVIGFIGCYDPIIQYNEHHEVTSAQFKLWRMRNNKVYENPIEEARRYRIFHSNVKLINKLNRQFRNQTTFALNKFADLTNDEFKSIYLMSDRSPVQFEEARYSYPPFDAPLPDYYDWATKGVVTSVKDQGSAGTCWAFSAVENIEGQWALQKQMPLVNLSVEQVADCDDSQDIKNGHADCGIFGGWPYLAYGYIQRAGGIEKDADYPYCMGGGGAPGTCFMCQAPYYNRTLCGPPIPWCNATCAEKIDPSKFVPGLNVSGWKAISQNETVIAQMLMTAGPLSIALDATMLQFYFGGIFNPFICSKKHLNHAVLLTGFGTKSGIFGREEYWIVKNSWGASWGKHGYFWMKRGSGVCGMNTAVTTATLK